MYRKASKKKELIKRIATYTAMTSLVLIIVSGLVLVLLGYRFDSGNGRVEQGGLVQFASTPPGATVEVDGKPMNAKTPAKISVTAGTHEFVMWREGYETWRKTVDVKAGTLTWLNYTRLVPKDKSTASVAEYTALAASLPTTDGQDILLQQDVALPTFQLVDLRADDIKSTTLTIPATIYSEAATVGVTHNFRIDQWDTAGRYALIQHTYGDKKEWLVLDTRNADATTNVTTLLDIDISSAKFSGNGGSILYALSGSDLRKLDLADGTISRSLVSGVTSFELFESNVITYVGLDKADPAKRVVGLYREGDSEPHILRTVAGDMNVPLRVTTARYFNQDYVAISEGSKVDITSGEYPSSSSDDNSSLATFGSFDFSGDVERLVFSPSGDYLMVQSGAKFSSYDIEHKKVYSSSISGDPKATVAPLKWLDDNYIWSSHGGVVTIREFDGTNSHTINQAIDGQAVVLSQSGRYIYSVGKTPDGYQLQRVRMILP